VVFFPATCVMRIDRSPRGVVSRACSALDSKFTILFYLAHIHQDLGRPAARFRPRSRRSDAVDGNDVQGRGDDVIEAARRLLLSLIRA
jgi:hypothetical protein